MSGQVQRYLLKAIPQDVHPKYFPWNIATLCILIGEDDKYAAEMKARKLIEKELWRPISSMHKSTLIEESVMALEEPVINEFLRVKSGSDSFMVFTDNWCGFKNSPPLLFPRITEQLIDKVFKAAGGERFEYAESIRKKNADYVIDDYIFELKIIEEERLINNSVQERMVDLLYDPTKVDIAISSDEFDELTYSIFTNIFRTPIENAIKSASKQIKSTKSLIPEGEFKSGLIIINNGTSSFTPQIFNDCILKCLNNNTRSIDEYVSISCWSETDGFNTTFQFEINPVEKTEIQRKIAVSFTETIQDYLTLWGRSLFNQTHDPLLPLKPISFEKDGVTYTKTSSP